MSNERVDLPLAPFLNTFLALGGSGPASELRTAVREYISANAVDADLLANFDAQRGGPCIPFELSDDERLVAQALIAKRDRYSHRDVYLFGALSMSDAGAVRARRDLSYAYFDSDPVSVGSDDSWFYPANTREYRSRVERLASDTREAKLVVDRELRVRLPLSDHSMARLGRSQRVSVTLLDDDFSSSAGGADLTVRADLDKQLMELSLVIPSPEDLLRVTASAELNGWLLVQSENFGAAVHLKPIGGAEDSLSCLVAGSDLEDLVMKDAARQTMSVPSALLPRVWSLIRRHPAIIVAPLLRTAHQLGLVHQ